MINMIWVCSNFHEARVLIVNHRPDEQVQGTADALLAESEKSIGEKEAQLAAERAAQKTTLQELTAEVRPHPRLLFPAVLLSSSPGQKHGT